MNQASHPIHRATAGWAWTGRAVSALAAGLFVAGCAQQILHGGDRLDLGYLFDVGLLSLGLLIYAGGRWMDDRAGMQEPLSALLAFAGAFLLAGGARLSASDLFSMAAFGWYIPAAGILGLAVLLRRESAAAEDAAAGRYRGAWAWMALALAAIVIVASIVWMDHQVHTVWDLFEDRTSTTLFFFRRTYGATDMVGAPFRDWDRLSAVVVMGVLLAMGALGLQRQRAEGSRKAFWYLLGAAILAKLAVAHLGTQSLLVFGAKVRSVNTNYLALSKWVDARGLYGFIRDYNGLQFNIGAHGDTHSFAPIVFYWVLSKLALGNDMAVGLAVASLCALIVWPIHALATRIYGTPKAGLAAALLYLCSPMSLMLSNAGIDGMAALLVALLIERLDAAACGGRWQAAAQAGVLLFLCSLMSFGGAVVLVFGGLWVLHRSLASTSDRVQGLARCAWILMLALLGALALHGGLYLATGGKFSFLASMSAATGAHKQANRFRIYGLWAWGNVFVYAGYLGIGSLAAWSLRLLKSLWQADGRDAFLAFGALQVLILILAAMGRGEVQREFLFGAFFLAVPTAAFVLKERAGALELRWGLLGALCLLNVATAVVLQVITLDFW